MHRQGYAIRLLLLLELLYPANVVRTSILVDMSWLPEFIFLNQLLDPYDKDFSFKLIVLLG